MPAAGTNLATLQLRFADFAASYAGLPLYSAVCRAVATDDECASLLQAAAPGQDRPVLWLAALHDLVLRQPDVPAARWYASVVGPDRLPSGDPWPDVRRTALAHADELRAVIGSRTTQTNEVNRSVYLAPSLALACQDHPGRPVVLVEMGASAGLLLQVDRYRVELTGPRGRVVLGEPTSTVRCAGRDRSDGPPVDGAAPLVLPTVAGRRGIDRHPVDLADADAVRWLEACLWPDVPGRVERFRSAVSLLAGTRNPVRTGDMVDDLPQLVGDACRAAPADAHLVVFSSWALTYVDRGRRPEVADVLAVAARDGRPVTWLTAEPPHCTPGIERSRGANGGRGSDHRPGHAVVARGVRAASTRTRHRPPTRRVGRPRLLAAGDLRAGWPRTSGPQERAALARHRVLTAWPFGPTVFGAGTDGAGNPVAHDRLGGGGQPPDLRHPGQPGDQRQQGVQVVCRQPVRPARQVAQRRNG